jgi:hypothetical protein
MLHRGPGVGVHAAITLTYTVLIATRKPTPNKVLPAFGESKLRQVNRYPLDLDYSKQPLSFDAH